MKIYLDLVLILNFFIDFILLIAVGIILKRKINIKLVTISSFIGSLSILLLFMKINSIELFFIKIVFSIIMILISYPKLNIKYVFYNFLVFYIVSIFLGGFLYFLKVGLNYKHYGLIFINNGFSINLIVILLFSPLILYLYIKEQKVIKNKYNNYYLTNIVINNKVIKCTGFIDSGNNLTYKRKPVILIDKKMVGDINNDYYMIPYKVVNKVMMLKIYKCDMVVINEHVFNDIYLGISDEGFNIDGIDLLLNNKLMEEI